MATATVEGEEGAGGATTSAKKLLAQFLVSRIFPGSEVVEDFLGFGRDFGLESEGVLVDSAGEVLEGCECGDDSSQRQPGYGLHVPGNR